MIMKRLFLIISALAVILSASAQDLTILHLNDTHSHIDPQRSGKHMGKGGVIEQAAYVDSVRAACGPENVLLLHAGDFSQGTSYFTELGGDIEIDVLNAMCFDAVTLGNHEFDNGMVELARRLRSLEVPVVCANYDFTGTPLEGLVKPYVILEKTGRKIGIIGLLTDVSSVVSAEIAAALKYIPATDVANSYAEKLRYDEGCDLVICLTHLGFDAESFTDVELAAASRNIDVIVGGHSHTHLEDLEKVRNLDGEEVTVVQDWKWGLEVGNLSVTFKPSMLLDKYRELRNESVFSHDGTWFPYPAYNDRESWAKMLGKHSEYLVSQGEKYLEYKWKNVPATAYLAFERTGERNIMQEPLKKNRIALNTLMLAELAEGKGRFVDQLIDGMWHICHMPSWVLSAHLPRQRSNRSLPDPREQLIDLGSGALGAQVAVAWHFFHETFDKVNPSISYVVEDAVKRQILDPYLDPAEYKANWWLGFDIEKGRLLNNWTPWCNADVILCFLLMEKDPERLELALKQSARSVDKFMAYIKTDGACEEGPAYWGHAAGKLYDYLQIMHDASGGRFSFFDTPMIRDMGEYISRSYVKDGWVVNFADATARLSFTPSLIYNYGNAVGSREMMDFAIYNLADKEKGAFRNPVPVIWNDAYRALESLRNIGQMTQQTEVLNARIASGETMESCMDSLRKNVPAFVWYPETEFCYMRHGNWFFAAKGGHNNESHNHNDIGTFSLYVDGLPVFVDAGVGTYTKKTFSAERYTIWSMQSDWHNLPLINGSSQVFGREHRSSDVSVSSRRDGGKFSLDISGAYMSAADCRSWKRTFDIKGGKLTITDKYILNNRVMPDVENFLVHGKVFLPGASTDSGYLVKAGEVIVCDGGVTMRLAYPASMTPSVEVMNLDDKRLTDVWGDSLRRISFTSAADAPVKGSYVFTITQIR